MKLSECIGSTRLSTQQLEQTKIQISEFVLSREAATLESQLSHISELVSLHPLTVEDCRKRNQRAKFEIFPNYFFIVLHYFSSDIDSITELHIIIRADKLIIIADHLAPDFSSWIDFLQLKSELNLAQVIHKVFDTCVDSAEQRATTIADLIEEAESLIIAEKYSPKQIIKLKRNALSFQRAIVATYPVLKELMASTELTTENELMFRNILDHQERLKHEIDFIHIELIALFDEYWGAASYTTNQEMKRLTLLATSLLPLAFWTSFFGMNFEVLPFKEGWFFGLAVLLMLTSVIGILFYLRRRRLLRGRLTL